MSVSTVPAEWPDAAIVVVDDDDVIHRMAGQVLQASGYRYVRTFADPQEALTSIGSEPAQLVLLDLHMPGLSGQEVLRQLTAGPVEWRPSVIIMTGASEPGDARTSLALGASDFVHKPVDTVELLLRVRHQLRERRLLADLARHNDRLEELVTERAGDLAMLSRVLDEIPIAAIVFDPDLEVRHANTRARRLLAVEGQDALTALAGGMEHRATLVAFLRGVVDAVPRRHTSRVVDRRRERRVEIEAQLLADGALVALVHDIEEQEVSKDVLRRALEREHRVNEQMRGVERLRTNFLSAVSHELRTPLTVVRGIAESLREHDQRLLDDQRRELLDRMLHNSVRLERLLEDLLDLNRLSAGHLTADRERCDVADLVRDALSTLELPEHHLEFDVASAVAELDETQMTRAIANLVRNAGVHTPPGTRIVVTTAVDDDFVVFRVADNGPGVPDDRRGRIFEPFEQGDDVRRHQPGTGIGLSLVTEFSRTHGGSAWVEDTPGGGATFVVEVPRWDPGLQEPTRLPAEGGQEVR